MKLSQILKHLTCSIITAAYLVTPVTAWSDELHLMPGNGDGTNMSRTSTDSRIDTPSTSPDAPPTRASGFHPHPLTLNGVDGIWLSNDEMIRLVMAAKKGSMLESISAEQDKALELAEQTIATSSSAIAQYKFALQQTTSLLMTCQSSCSSVWREPVLPLSVGVIAGALMCIGTARAQR